MLSTEAPRLDRQGLLLSLGGEPWPASAAAGHPSPSLPLTPLVRGLAQILGMASPPPSVLPRLLASPHMGLQSLRILRVLTSSRAAAWGPAWDLLSDLVRLLGLWL